MLVEIPKRHYKYIQIMVQAKLASDEDKAKKIVFEEGLDETEGDIAIGATEPDMEMSLLSGKKITIEVPDNPEYLQRLELVSQAFRVTRARAASIVFLLGLFDQYLSLKYSELYQKDKTFRRMVKEMPHELDYDRN